MLHAAKVPQSLLAHDPHEHDIVVGLDPGLLQRAQYRQHHDQPTRVVPDAGCEEGVAPLSHGHVRAFGEDGVQVAAQRHGTLAPPAPSEAEHVAFSVGPHGIGAVLGQQFGEPAATHFAGVVGGNGGLGADVGMGHDREEQG